MVRARGSYPRRPGFDSLHRHSHKLPRPSFESTSMLETRIRQFLAANSLLEPEDRVLVAYSGGPDSTCLLLLLREIHPETAAVYVNHRLRGEESVQEEAFVRNFCEKRGIPLYVEHLSWRKQPSNLEETARKRRYLHLTKAAQEHGFTKVALAHHSDDAAETFLLRLLRGSGPRGLAGPMPRRGLFIRPLLQPSHAEILSYLQDREIPFFADSSNQDRSTCVTESVLSCCRFWRSITIRRSGTP